MDFIFECFYTDTLDKISRNGLQDRSSRRDVLDHLNAIIGGCSDGQNMNTDEVARIAVLSAVRYHREQKDANGDVCLMGKYHNILYIALRTCWDWGVRDSAVVVVLLEEIYACEKTFERIFLGALFGPHAPHFIAGWRSDFRDQDENTRAMVYFLHHATSLDMTLPCWIARYEQERMVKFIDIPIESCGRSSPLRVALQASAPDLLLILLRYGANPNPPDGGSSAVLALLDKLTENGRNYVYQNVSCLQILLRNIPMIELPYKPIIYSTRREMFFERYGRLLIDKIIPKEQVYGVMSLRHLCRCRIRDLLRHNGQLPDGIDTLRLPRRLQRYIDLMEEIEGPDKDKDNDDDDDYPTTSKASQKKKTAKKSIPRVKVLTAIEEEEKPTTSLAAASTTPLEVIEATVTETVTTTEDSDVVKETNTSTELPTTNTTTTDTTLVGQASELDQQLQTISIAEVKIDATDSPPSSLSDEDTTTTTTAPVIIFDKPFSL
ncbi:SOCS domain-containing protein stops isoform X2 [Musca autumnalis]|uniref:SOCS domain-containing protein stops isoform X2 n=1 Tax=Musca autumnalis TaxID=221902 RepID=UPI003CEF7E54